MVAPADAPGWGPPETELLRVLLAPGERVESVEWAWRADPRVAHWLPALQHRLWDYTFDEPALLITCGLNAGGFQNNRNDLRTDVWLRLPREPSSAA